MIYSKSTLHHCPQLTGHTAIMQHPGCVYTTFRTVGRTRIPGLDVHVCRLKSSQLAEPVILAAFQEALTIFLPHFEGEIRVYAFADQGIEFFAEALPAAPHNAVFGICKAQRKDPTVKSVNWALQRR